MGTITILPETTKNPITLVGQRAGVCWEADTSDAEKNYKRGWDCIQSGHGRVMEYVNIELVISDYSARVMREWYTHIYGYENNEPPTRLQSSTRYIDYGNFKYIIPKSVEKNPEAKRLYVNANRMLQDTIKELGGLGISREDSANLLPIGMTTRIVDKRNLRSLIDMSHQRMCNRAYWEYRQMFADICEALSAYSNEWETIVMTQMKSKCDVLGYCTEKDGCGRKPRR